MLNRLTYICCDEYEHLTNEGEITELIVQRTGKVGYIDTKISNRETILAAKCQGDYCRLVLDLPFQTKKKALKMHFTTESLMKSIH
jgi:hypothetical protein